MWHLFSDEKVFNSLRKEAKISFIEFLTNYKNNNKKGEINVLEKALWDRPT